MNRSGILITRLSKSTADEKIRNEKTVVQIHVGSKPGCYTCQSMYAGTGNQRLFTHHSIMMPGPNNLSYELDVWLTHCIYIRLKKKISFRIEITPVFVDA